MKGDFKCLAGCPVYLYGPAHALIFLSLSHLFFISQAGDSEPQSSRHFSLLDPPENNKQHS